MEEKDSSLAWQERSPTPGRGARATPRRLRLGSSLRRGLVVFAMALLVAVGCVGLLMAVSWVRSQEAVKVVRAQLEAIRQGEVEQAYGFFSKGYQAGISLPRFRRWLRREERLAKVQHIQFWRRSVWRNTAVLWGSFQDELGHSYPARYVLIREDSSWRIDSFHLSAEVPDPILEDERILYI